MDNGIIKRQSDNENIFKLTAQRHMYSKAKIILGIQIITQVILIIGLALLPVLLSDSFLLAHNIKKEHFTTFTVCSSLVLVVFDLLIMTPLIKRKRELAASVQEDYDCTVLSISWNDVKVDKPDGEIISNYANEFIKTKGEEAADTLEGFKYWYSPEDIKTIPLEAARIICQRTNCWWDNYLRNKYKRDIIICAAGLFSILFLIGIIREMSVPNLIINVFAPFFPALTFTVVQVRENTDSIKCTEKLKIISDSYWNKLISDPSNLTLLNDLSRKLQDQIFDSRKSSPLIFDWYYEKYKPTQQTDTNSAVQLMINAYKSINPN